MSPTTLDWSEIQTVFLDMDGTLLDLNYDNKVWNDLLPQAYANHHRLPLADARELLMSHMREIYGSIEFYSFDYWQDYTKLDIIDLHRTATHLVAYRPGAEEFLDWLERTGRRGILTTNAHRDSLMVKDEHSGICDRVESVVSSHDYQTPKESPDFWEQLQEDIGFEPETSMLVDDNEPVLTTANRFGIRHTLSIKTPDSNRPPRTELNFPSFDDFAEICPELTG